VDETYDVVVVGAGAAGLGGAVALARARRSVLVVDAGQPRNAAAGHVHNHLTRDGTPPAELLAAGRAEVIRYGGEVVAGRVEAAVRRATASWSCWPAGTACGPGDCW
jgi:thioredoxin reductase